MTTGIGRHARLGGLAKGWHRFRRWRRSRPFWGGLFLVLAGLEIFATTQASLRGLTFQMGPTGFLSWLIPTILVVCGLLIWFTPQQRMFYAVVGAITALYSLIGVNLGGFFIGLLLGTVGGALAFAWTPGPSQAVAVGRVPASAHAGDDLSDEQLSAPHPDSTVDELLDGPITESLPQQRAPEPVEVDEPTEAEPVEADERTERQPVEADERTDSEPGGPGPLRNPPAYVITLLAMALGATALVVGSGGSAHAEPCPGPAISAAPSLQTASPTGADVNLSAPAALASPLPIVVASPSPASGSTSSPSPSASPVASGSPPSSSPSPPAAGTPSPSACPAPRPTGSPLPPGPTGSPSEAQGHPESPSPAPAGEVGRLAADPTQPSVAAAPSHLTGSRMTMYGLRLEGIVDLPTAAGPLRVLKFTMSRAVTDDFALRIAGADRLLRIKSELLTVEGNVTFYTTRFVGWILGIKVTLTPDSPLPPDGVDLTLPVLAFSDPDVQLAFVDCDTLTASPLDETFT